MTQKKQKKKDQSQIKMVAHFHTCYTVKTYIHTKINMMLYLEKGLKLVLEIRHWKICKL